MPGLAEKYPYHVNVPLTENWSKRYDWCVATFGNFDNWMYGATCFYFKHEKDAVLYSLRWL